MNLKNRVAIIGGNDFSAHNYFSLLMTGAVSELVLIDFEHEATFDEILKLLKSIPLGFETNVYRGGYEEAAGADIAVIASNVSVIENESHFDSLERSVSGVREIVRNLKANGFDDIILVASNPVDVLAHAAFYESGFPAHKIIGSGKTLTNGQFKSWDQGPTPDVRAPDQSHDTSTWCAAMACDSPLTDNCQPNCPEFGKMLDADQKQPVQSSNRYDRSPLAVGSCIPRLCEAILRDERTILPAVVMANGNYGISGVYLNQPCVIRRTGIEEVIKLDLEDLEIKELVDSSEAVRMIIKRFLPDGLCSSMITS